MSKHDDWFDDFIIMKMMEEDDCQRDDVPSSNSSDSGCFATVLGVLAGLWILAKLIG
jgi:hypothetical protein